MVEDFNQEINKINPLDISKIKEYLMVDDYQSAYELIIDNKEIWEELEYMVGSQLGEFY